MDWTRRVLRLSDPLRMGQRYDIYGTSLPWIPFVACSLRSSDRSLRAILVFSLLFIILMRKMRLVFSQVTDSFQINRPHVAYTILGGFTSIFMLCSLFIKEKLYIGEASEFSQESLGEGGRAPRADGRV